jgi:hypothetical protein
MAGRVVGLDLSGKVILPPIAYLRSLRHRYRCCEVDVFYFKLSPDYKPELDVRTAVSRRFHILSFVAHQIKSST